ncbi:MAG: hypothetical protein FJY37_05540 [Betaproteobacteria bacterium]|nr:hypothetical protein [Betaproteobacteria bacterium]
MAAWRVSGSGAGSAVQRQSYRTASIDGIEIRLLDQQSVLHGCSQPVDDAVPIRTGTQFTARGAFKGDALLALFPEQFEHGAQDGLMRDLPAWLAARTHAAACPRGQCRVGHSYDGDLLHESIFGVGELPR